MCFAWVDLWLVAVLCFCLWYSMVCLFLRLVFCFGGLLLVERVCVGCLIVLLCYVAFRWSWWLMFGCFVVMLCCIVWL